MRPTLLEDLWRVHEPTLVSARASEAARKCARQSFQSGTLALMTVIVAAAESGERAVVEVFDAIAKELELRSKR